MKARVPGVTKAGAQPGQEGKGCEEERRLQDPEPRMLPLGDVTPRAARACSGPGSSLAAPRARGKQTASDSALELPW